jgi:hypothetical protein
MIDGMNGEVRIVDRASKDTPALRPARRLIGQFTALHNIAVDRQGISSRPGEYRQRVQKFRRLDMQN